MLICTVIIIILSNLIPFSWGGHEVLYKFIPQKDDIKPEELAIIQFDTRQPLSGYWEASAYWNRAFAEKYGHQYSFFTMDGSCKYASFDLSPVWCKVKAMRDAMNIMPLAKAFIYLDSDAVVTTNYSMTVVLGYIRKYLKWDYNQQPVAFNQDGPGWACKSALLKGLPLCLNSGTLFWVRSIKSEQILEDWWNSAGDSYKESLFTQKWRLQWPWEQAQMYKIHSKHNESIMILSFPDKPFLPWYSTKKPKSQYPTDAIEPWCFSHWPLANCFITHHCASINQKMKLIEWYKVNYTLPVIQQKIPPC